MTTEEQKALDDKLRTVEEFKRTIDERLKAIDEGRGFAELEEKIKKMNDAFDRGERRDRERAAELEAREMKLSAERASFEAEQKSRMDQIEARANRLIVGKLLGDRGEGNESSRAAAEKKALSNFLRRGNEALSPEERKSLVVSSDTGAGYLATSELSADIVKKVVERSLLRPIVRVKTITGHELIQRKQTTAPTATRMGEQQTRAETGNPAYGQVKIEAPEMFAEALVSTQMLEDSGFDLEAELSADFALQFAKKEGAEIVNGTGIEQCLGFLQANAAGTGIPIAYTVSGAAATIAGAADGSAGQGNGLVNLLHDLIGDYADSPNARWVLNRNSLGKIRSLKDTTGAYLWQQSLIPGNPPLILGVPYVVAPDMPNQGANAFPVAFGDFMSAYTVVDRTSFSLQRDPYTVPGFVKFTARKRMGGKVVLAEAIRLLKCST